MLPSNSAFRYRKLYDLQAGIESLDIVPESDEERLEIFEFKRGIVKALVYRITIDKRRELKGEVKFNALEMLVQTAQRDFSSVNMA